MNLEDELRAALARREPPPGFAERVLARARPAARARRMYSVAAWAVAAGLLVAAGLQYERHRRGEHAKEQVLLALRVAGQELHAAREKVRQLSQTTMEKR
jgi:hypothetical protein